MVADSRDQSELSTSARTVSVVDDVGDDTTRAEVGNFVGPAFQDFAARTDVGGNKRNARCACFQDDERLAFRQRGQHDDAIYPCLESRWPGGPESGGLAGRVFCSVSGLARAACSPGRSFAVYLLVRQRLLL